MGKAVQSGTDLSNTTQDFAKLIRKAEGGDKESLAALRKMFDAVPRLWDELGNMAEQAGRSLIKAAAGDSKLTAEAMQRTWETLEADLAGPSPSPLEKLLAERVALCWLQLHYADTVYTQNMKDLSIRQAEFHQRRISQYQQRYLSAIRTLAVVRRLLRPAVAQINIADRQVNIAAASKESVPAPADVRDGLDEGVLRHASQMTSGAN